MARAAKPKVDPYLDGLMAKLLDRLTSIERKLDAVMSRATKPSNGAPPPPQAEKPRRERQLYEAICADCSKVCEVPFMPTENRPVYCKICWAKRKGRPHGMPTLTPVSLPPKPVSKLASAPPPPAPLSKKPKKPAAQKKPAKKKKR